MLEPPAIPSWAKGFDQLATIKAQLRLDGDAQDELLALQWEAAIDELDGASGGLNRSLRPVILVQAIDAGAARQILPLRPVVEIGTVEQRRGDVWEALPTESWALVGDHELEQRARAPGADRRVTYLAGYLTELPARVMRILLLKVEEAIMGADPNRTRAIETAIQRFRLPGIG